MAERSNQLISLEELYERNDEADIHSTAVVAPTVKLGKGVVIGAYCRITGDVEIGDYATVMQNAIIEGRVRIGRAGIIHPFTIIGNLSHDLKYNDAEKTFVSIGDDCVIREFTNIHAGTPEDGYLGTVIHDDVFIMSHSHVGHDCDIGAHALLSQQTTLGGVVKIAEHAIIGGCSAIHQFCTIGKYSIIGGCSKITQDVIPFAMSDGNPQSLDGLNLVGLKRNNFSDEDIRAIKEVYKTLFISEEGVWDERVEMARRVYGNHPVAGEIIRFIDGSRRVIARPRKHREL